ncbi:MAG: hypothetical protein LC737_05325, partial [Chloroflexi bacterium]|nr:hypothetical protein [Chloroflexota bacterium]
MSKRRPTGQSGRRTNNEQRTRFALRRSFLIVGLIIIGAVAGWFAGQFLEQRTQPRGIVLGVPPKVALADHSFGVTVDLMRMSADGRAHFYEQAKQLGIRWVRLPISWRAVDAHFTPSGFDWTTLDALIEEIRAQRIAGMPLNILGALNDVPDWARDPKLLPAGQPPQDWRV